MNFLKKIFKIFFSNAKENIKIELPENSIELLKKIENQELKNLAEKIYILSVNVNNLLETQKQQQEMLVAIATLHEELLYQLDQGNVVMIKRKEFSSTEEDEKDSDISNKKKYSLN